MVPQILAIGRGCLIVDEDSPPVTVERIPRPQSCVPCLPYLGRYPRARKRLIISNSLQGILTVLQGKQAPGIAPPPPPIPPKCRQRRLGRWLNVVAWGFTGNAVLEIEWYILHTYRGGWWGWFDRSTVLNLFRSVGVFWVQTLKTREILWRLRRCSVCVRYPELLSIEFACVKTCAR